MELWTYILIHLVTVVCLAIYARRTIKNLIQTAIDEVSGAILGSPRYKQAMGILGSKSGEVRRNTALENEIARNVMDKVIGKWKVPLGFIGIDLDDLMERYTPMELLGALETFGPMIQSFMGGKGLKKGTVLP